jgi:hypothetical protein
VQGLGFGYSGADRPHIYVWDRDDADVMHFLHALTLEPDGGVKVQGDGMKATNTRNNGVKEGGCLLSTREGGASRTCLAP